MNHFITPTGSEIGCLARIKFLIPLLKWDWGSSHTTCVSLSCSNGSRYQVYKCSLGTRHEVGFSNRRMPLQVLIRQPRPWSRLCSTNSSCLLLLWDRKWDMVFESRSPLRQNLMRFAADIQKFRASLLFIGAGNPTEVTEDEITSMATAKHFRNRDAMSYEARNYPNSQWKHHMAFKGLCLHEIFSDDGSKSALN